MTSTGITAPPLLEVSRLKVSYPARKGLLGKVHTHVHAVDGVSLRLERGETLGLVGESGCGKSTLGRTVLALQAASSGQVKLHGEDIFGLSAEALRRRRRRIQLIFQHPKGCFDPRRTVGRSVGMALDLQQVLPYDERDAAVAAMFTRIGLRAEHMYRYPHEFSGGQLQRIAIARALILQPELVVCDEPVSALDVSVQAQILNLLKDLQSEFSLAFLFISHNLAVIHYMADRVAVMYYGRIVEIASRQSLFSNPRHPYTKMLLASVPSMSLTSGQGMPASARLGEPPDPSNLPLGCRFQSRCPLAFERCRTSEPDLQPLGGTDGMIDAAAGPGVHAVACWASGKPDATGADTEAGARTDAGEGTRQAAPRPPSA